METAFAQRVHYPTQIFSLAQAELLRALVHFSRGKDFCE